MLYTKPIRIELNNLHQFPDLKDSVSLIGDIAALLRNELVRELSIELRMVLSIDIRDWD
jgi:hypothetical protein